MEHYPCEIGGRDIDLKQIGYSLDTLVQEEFPDGCVPVSVLYVVQEMQRSLAKAGSDVKRCIRLVRQYDGHEGFLG